MSDVFLSYSHDDVHKAEMGWERATDFAGSNTYTFRQKSNGRFVDAHEYKGKDYGLVTRDAQNNNTQRWMIRRAGANTFTIRQNSNSRFVDAHVAGNMDFAVVTRKPQNNDTQRWILTPK